MTEGSPFLHYRSLCEHALEALRALEPAYRAYRSVFPTSLAQGLFSTQACSGKAITRAYYEYAAALCRCLEQMETDVLRISRLMQCSDEHMEVALVLHCEEWLKRYEVLRQEWNKGLTQSEGLLLRESEELPLSELFRNGQQIKETADRFCAFLTQECQRTIE